MDRFIAVAALFTGFGAGHLIGRPKVPLQKRNDDLNTHLFELGAEVDRLIGHPHNVVYYPEDQMARINT